MVTLDGYFEGSNESIEWHNVDDEFNQFAIKQLEEADMLLFGRVTYELMAGYWPSPAAATDDPKVAYKMNTISKIVFSKTMVTANWENTRLIKENIQEEVTLLKKQPGKDIYIFGSADLASTLREMNLIDEYRIMVNPLVIGRGKPLFANINQILNLRLLDIKRFDSGNVLLYYESKRD
jgi:dihydrofolate reductase